MTQLNMIDVKLPNSLFNKLKLSITEVILNLSSNVIGNLNGEINFLHKLFLTDRQDLRLQKGFANNSLANIK